MEEVVSIEKVIFTRTEGYDGIYALIDEGKYDEAKAALEERETKNDDRHYILAEIFYKKKWYDECKKQLELAIKEDDDNAWYKATYEQLCEYAASEDGKKSKHKKNMGGDFIEGCSGCCAYCAAEALCEILCNLICDGCS